MEYVNHEQAEMRMLVADAVVRYIKRTKAQDIPESASKAISSILNLLGGDENPSVQEYMVQHQEFIIAKLEDTSIIKGLLKLLGNNDKKSNQKVETILELIAKEDLDRSLHIIKQLISKNLQDEELKPLFKYLNQVEAINHSKMVDFLKQFLTPQIAHGYSILVHKCLEFIKHHARSYEENFAELSPQLYALLDHPDVSIIALTLETFSRITKSADHAAEVMRKFNNIQQQDAEIIRQKIGCIVSFTNIEPKWFPQFFDYIEILSLIHI